MILANLQDLQLELFLRLREKIVWKTKDGTIVPINKMSDNHLINTINMIKRQRIKEQEEQEELDIIYSDLIGLDMNDIS